MNLNDGLDGFVTATDEQYFYNRKTGAGYTKEQLTMQNGFNQFDSNISANMNQCKVQDNGWWSTDAEGNRVATGTILGEFLGTFGLVFFILAMVIARNKAATTPGLPFPSDTVVFMAISLFGSLAYYNAANLNPVVTIAMIARGYQTPLRGFVIILAQLLGGLAAGYTISLVLGPAAIVAAVIAPGAGVLDDLWTPFIMEAIAFVFFLWNVLATSGPYRKKFGAVGILINGFALGAAHVLTAPYSSGVLNWAYAVGNLIPAATATPPATIAPGTWAYSFLGHTTGGVVVFIVWWFLYEFRQPERQLNMKDQGSMA